MTCQNSQTGKQPASNQLHLTKTKVRHRVSIRGVLAPEVQLLVHPGKALQTQRQMQ